MVNPHPLRVSPELAVQSMPTLLLCQGKQVLLRAETLAEFADTELLEEFCRVQEP